MSILTLNQTNTIFPVKCEEQKEEITKPENPGVNFST